MHLTYKKLWKLLIDKSIKKSELAERAQISRSTLAKLTKNENVNTDILIRICFVLDCDIGDIAAIEYDM